MANGDPPTTKPDFAKPAANRPESLPVHSLVLAHPVDGIGANGLTGLKSSAPDAPVNRHRNVITFVPYMRHFRIDHYPVNSNEPIVHMVYEGLVKSWRLG